MKKMPSLSFWQIWNLSFGFLGVQFGFALQNANASRILTSLGADPHNLSFFWLVAPIMGLIVQPVVGAASDKTWTRIGRRSPYILLGAVVSMIAMFFMPNAPLIFKAGGVATLAFGVIMLALMDGSFNVTFQPFRALVADMTPEEQGDYEALIAPDVVPSTTASTTAGTTAGEIAGDTGADVAVDTGLGAVAAADAWNPIGWIIGAGLAIGAVTEAVGAVGDQAKASADQATADQVKLPQQPPVNFAGSLVTPIQNSLARTQ